MQVKSIAEQLFFTTVRIDTINADGNECSGTGFFFGHKSPFIVTNKHVVSGMQKGKFSFLKQRDRLPILGEGLTVDVDCQQWLEMWFGHPDQNVDISIFPFGAVLESVERNNAISYSSDELFYRALRTDMIPSEEQALELDAIEPVTFIGYPNGVWDTKNLLPIARRGVTASPIEVDFNGRPCFLIDASVFGGSSGSPVFILEPIGYAKKDGSVIIGGPRFHFIGVIAEAFHRTNLGQIVPVSIPTQVKAMAQQKEMIDLGIVFKARTVVETIEAFFKAHNINTAT